MKKDSENIKSLNPYSLEDFPLNEGRYLLRMKNGKIVLGSVYYCQVQKEFNVFVYENGTESSGTFTEDAFTHIYY